MAETSSDLFQVLHVDDEPDFADMAADFLQREDDRFTVETATDASEGRNRLTDTDYDCVVSDFEMPGQNGIEFLETVREEYPDLPFILYTGKGSEEVASDALSAGATDYLQKGSSTDQYELLANRITNAIEQYRAARRAAELDRIRTIRSQIDQALVRSESRADAETRVCEIISDSEPYLFAWIGDIDSDTDSIEPRAWAGIEDGYLDTITVTADDTATGHGPGGTALRERRIAVSQNVHEDPEFEPWRQDALDRGYQAVAAVPLQFEDRFYGVLGVYSERPYAFDEAEEALLEDIGTDIVSAVHSFETRRAFREERAFIEQALNSINDIFYVITPEGTLSRVNDHACEVTGYSPPELLSMEPTDLFPPADRERVEADTRAAFDTGSSSLEADLLTNDGEVIPYEFRKRRLTDSEGNTIGLVGIGRDISDRKQRERELERQNERLDAFAGVVSHDLRNPLNVAQGRLELAREDCDTQHHDAIGTALDRIERIIGDVLWLARAGQDIGSVAPVALEEAGDSAWEMVPNQADDPDLRYTRDERQVPTINADNDRLRQLLENLFKNAIQHGGDDVTITLGPLADGFYVEDDGPGIPETERDMVFEAGYSTAEEGTGFGLNIVKQIVQAHGWEIRLTEGTTGGTRFEITGVEFTTE